MERAKQKTIPSDWLACPVTKAPLTERDGHLETSAARYDRNAEHGFWDFVPKDKSVSGPAWAAWEKLQENGMVSYEADPIANIAVGKIPEYVAFGQFCDFHGKVLDIGVGPQRSPTHFDECTKDDVFFVGVDPLIGQQPRDFAFIQALGEFLPFRDGLFDQVLFVTSLDHFIDPTLALKEAVRVMADDGVLCIFHGEKDKDAPRPAKSPEWYRSLVVPEGAEDPFHMRRFSAKELEGYLQALELSTIELETREVDKWRREFFYKVVKSKSPRNTKA
jgi:SAM-dependent methyltransferase